MCLVKLQKQDEVIFITFLLKDITIPNVKKKQQSVLEKLKLMIIINIMKVTATVFLLRVSKIASDSEVEYLARIASFNNFSSRFII